MKLETTLVEILEQFNKILKLDTRYSLKKATLINEGSLVGLVIINYGNKTIFRSTFSKAFEDITLLTKEAREAEDKEILELCYEKLLHDLVCSGITRESELWDAGVFKDESGSITYNEYKIKLKR